MTGSNFKKIVCGVVGAALSLVIGSAHADPLVITESAVATGTLGAFTFADALLTITVDQVYSERSKICSTPGTTVIGTCTGEFGVETVIIAGVGTAVLTDTIAAFINTRGGYGLLGSAGISDESLNNPSGNAIFNT